MLLLDLLRYWDLNLELWKAILPLRERSPPYAWGKQGLKKVNHKFLLSFGLFIKLALKKLNPLWTFQLLEQTDSFNA